MQYAPKLKIAMEEIKAVFEKYDIGGFAVLHTPGFAEFFSKVDPSYSCAKFEHLPDGQTGVRFRSKLADYDGDKEAWHTKTSDTVNLLQNVVDAAAPTMMVFMDMIEALQKQLKIENTGGDMTGHIDQNN